MFARLLTASTAAAAALLCWTSQAHAITVEHWDDGRAKTFTFVVGVTPFEPLVIDNGDGTFSGFDIDLWNQIMEEMSLVYQIEHRTVFKKMEFGELLRAVEAGEIDAALAGITITRDRESAFDFSQHYFDSGLRILVNKEQESGIGEMMAAIWNSEFLDWFLIFLAFLVVCAHLIWISELGKDGIDDRYFPGILEALWFANITSTTVGYGDYCVKRWLARVVTTLVAWIGIGISGIFIGQVATLMTFDQLESHIKSIDDLMGKQVATVANTTSETTLRERGIDVVGVGNINEAYTLLEKKEVEAVVFDAPCILYQARKRSDVFRTAGPVFERQYYGIAIPSDRTHREERINMAILKFRKNGVYDHLYRKWFGDIDQ